MRKLVWTLVALVVAVPLHAQERWDLTRARVSVRLNAGLMRDLGIRVAPAVRLDKDGYAAYELGGRGGLVAVAPGSIFRTVDMGELAITTGPSLSWKGDGTTLRGARLRPGREDNTFVISGTDGVPLFFADHEHWTIDRKARALRLFNLDLRLSAELAARLGEPRHEGLAVGVLEINAAAGIPKFAVETPLGACTTPNWGNPDNDVSLINLSQVSQVARGNGVVAVAPSAVLKNVGVTEVPWIAKFAAPGPPYNNDQHPFLVWNMYRVSNGRLEQIGASGAKHAFLTLNTNCGCPSGNTLWVNCEDTYGVGTNDSSGGIGPRSEITAHTGVWQRCGSVFDVNCDGIANSVPGFTGASDPRRMGVLETDLQVAGAQYFQDGWYVVRDDNNIFNTMAYRPITPSFGGTSWSFGLGAQSFGAVADAWVNPVNPGPNSDNQRVNTPDGHLTIAVKATDLGGGVWRYSYALTNHDYDNGIITFAVPIPTGAGISSTYFHDVDRDPGTDWVVNVNTPNRVRFQPPKSAQVVTRFVMDWGYLYTFSFEVNSPPTGRAGSVVELGVLEGPTRFLNVPVLGPTP